MNTDDVLSCLGSSPLTRGKLIDQTFTHGKLRLIPAHAGKTRTWSASSRTSPAHPRSRGENDGAIKNLSIGFGSSPLTRGKQRGRPERGEDHRLIPAHAGKTERFRLALVASWAHPRSRGENQRVHFGKVLAVGSSPLTRGKPARTSWPTMACGLIPAHAGKTEPGLLCPILHWAHPRSRGENESWCFGAHVLSGSSPLTRGKLGLAHRVRGFGGLIPAHAGKTEGDVPAGCGHGAHPRSRGENYWWRRRARGRGGSSPLTRGKPGGQRDGYASGRLIPAHAGKTLQTVTEDNAETAHPRSRGENVCPFADVAAFAGSSPLTRGKLPLGCHARCHARLIPAHAGKTRS